MVKKDTEIGDDCGEESREEAHKKNNMNSQMSDKILTKAGSGNE